MPYTTVSYQNELILCLSLKEVFKMLEFQKKSQSINTFLFQGISFHTFDLLNRSILIPNYH